LQADTQTALSSRFTCDRYADVRLCWNPPPLVRIQLNPSYPLPADVLYGWPHWCHDRPRLRLV